MMTESFNPGYKRNFFYDFEFDFFLTLIVSIGLEELIGK